ncbi:hypothetical protein BANRA_05523 [Escherichia coli]|nr:hypothetical protein BANRA_05523 [Escherichia coli]
MLTNDFVGLFQQRSRSMGCVSLFIIYSLNKDISLRRAWLADKYTTLVAERLTGNFGFCMLIKLRIGFYQVQCDAFVNLAIDLLDIRPKFRRAAAPVGQDLLTQSPEFS